MQLKALLDYVLEHLPEQNFDCLAFSIIDFNQNKWKSFEVVDNFNVSGDPYLYFDLASLTKPLTLSTTYHKTPEYLTAESLLTLEHRAGLPEWGKLDRKTWKEQVLSYPIKEAPTAYSCFSALRTMLEIEKKSGKKLQDLCTYFWSDDICHWKDLPAGSCSPSTGWRRGKAICGEVNDDNAFVIGEFISNSGLFATIDGLSQSLLNLQRMTSFIDQVNKEFSKRQPERFLWGWDTVTNPQDTLAGVGAGKKTFGHLGFTGTSIWIDSDKKIGWVLLTNGTQSYWHERVGLNQLRKYLGERVWNLS